MAEKRESAFKREIGKNRLEFLFDGIFAIAMTLLVLELKLPELKDHHSVRELGQALLHHGRTFYSYILSFFILGGFWVGHNRIYRHLQRISPPVLFIHFWLLSTAAFFPFCAHLYGRYPSNPLATLIYFGGVIAYLLGMLALILAAERGKLFDPQVPARDVRRLRRRFVLSMVILVAFYLLVFGTKVFR